MVNIIHEYLCSVCCYVSRSALILLIWIFSFFLLIWLSFVNLLYLFQEPTFMLLLLHSVLLACLSLALSFLPWFQLFFLSTASVWFVLVFPNLLSVLLNYLFEVHLIVNVSTQSNAFPFKTFSFYPRDFSKLRSHFYLIPRLFPFCP